MPKKKKILINLLHISFLIVFLCISGYIYYGFYFPDPTIFFVNSFTKLFLTVLKIIFPIIIIILVTLYILYYLKKIAFSSIILLLFTLFFLLLLFYPIADYYYRNNSGVNTTDLHPYLQIDPAKILDFTSETYNIFCLGGSTTEFADELGRDWPGLVEVALNKDSSEPHIRLYNLGKQWYTTQHILINYELTLSRYKPDAIIVMENINDLLHNADFSWLSSGKYSDDYGHFLGPLARLVKHKSFAEFIKNLLKESWYSDEFVEVETDSFPGLSAYERNLRSLIEIAKRDETKIILMTQPYIYKNRMSPEELNKLTMLNVEAIGGGKKWNYKTALNGFIKYNDKIRELAFTNKEVFLIDLEKAVPKSLEYFIDDVHYNSKAHDLISKYLYDEIKKFLLIK